MDWDAWCARSLAEEDIVRVILDGMMIRTRLDIKATNIPVLGAIGVRRDGQKILLSIRHMDGERPRPGAVRAACAAASATTVQPHLDELDARGLRPPTS